MARNLRIILSSACILLAALAAGGQELPFSQAPPFLEQPGQGPFRVRAVPSHNRVTPGQTFHVALVGELDEGWLYYSPHPGPDVIAGSVAADAGPLRPGETLWPKDKSKAIDYGEGPVVNHGYTGRFAVYVPLTVPAEAPAGPVAVELRPEGQICLDVCINLTGRGAVFARTEVTVGPAAEANPQWTDELAAGLRRAMPAARLKELHAEAGQSAKVSFFSDEAARLTVWAGLGLALLAGLTLNIMPCVLPIIPLRIYSLVRMAGDTRRRYITLGLAFAGGIVLFFLGLAAVNVALRLAGAAAFDVNEAFQYAWVRIALAAVLLAIAANLFGLFNVTVPGKVASMEGGGKSTGHGSAVGMGVMMAIMSTPCSFGFMALALAWAQVQPLWLGAAAIFAMGVGMAAPHILLAAMPQLVKVLPKPGRWMELFKQAMGFLLLPAVLYVLSTFAPDTAAGRYPFLLAGFCVVLAMGLWMWGSWVRYDAPAVRKLIVRGAAVGIVAVAGWMLLPAPSGPLVKFEPFDAARLNQAREDGRMVVLKVTASWCTECKILDYQVFNTPETAEAFRRHDVLAMKADVTNADSPAAVWVNNTFGVSPPLTVVYPPRGEPQARVGRFGKREFLDWLEAASDAASGLAADPPPK